MGIVIELIVQHCLWRPVEHLAVIRVVSGSLVVRIGWIEGSTELSTELFGLIAEIETGSLSY